MLLWLTAWVDRLLDRLTCSKIAVLSDEHIITYTSFKRYIALPTGPIIQKLNFIKKLLFKVIDLILFESNISHFKCLKFFLIYDLDVIKEPDAAYNLQDCITRLGLNAFTQKKGKSHQLDKIRIGITNQMTPQLW